MLKKRLKLETKHCLTYTLYSHNLWRPERSFAEDIKLEDFGRQVWNDITKANKVVYINPKGTSIILRDKNGVK